LSVMLVAPAVPFVVASESRCVTAGSITYGTGSFESSSRRPSVHEPRVGVDCPARAARRDVATAQVEDLRGQDRERPEPPVRAERHGAVRADARRRPARVEVPAPRAGADAAVDGEVLLRHVAAEDDRLLAERRGAGRAAAVARPAAGDAGGGDVELRAEARDADARRPRLARGPRSSTRARGARGRRPGRPRSRRTTRGDCGRVGCSWPPRPAASRVRRDRPRRRRLGDDPPATTKPRVLGDMPSRRRRSMHLGYLAWSSGGNGRNGGSPLAERSGSVTT
jgi:hypothetical protein